MQWSERTWAFPAGLEAVGGAEILPVGATEQHGPHLGSGVERVRTAHVVDGND
jgi:creatinine amidohydrolase